jgi:hypothetical protein
MWAIPLLAFMLIADAAEATQGGLNMPTSFRFPNFLNHPKLQFLGDARTEVAELVVAGPQRKQTGAVWFTEPMVLAQGFFSEFSVSISKVDNRGGEGIAFVVQSDSEYALGSGIEGLGYEGLMEGFALEVDGRRDVHQKVDDKDDDGAHVSVKKALRPGERLRSDHAEEKDERVVPIPNFAQFNKPLDVRVEYDANSQELVCSFNVATKPHLVEWMEGIRTKLQFVKPDQRFYVGFTASTGHNSAARLSVQKWRFGARAQQGCVRGFNSVECSVGEEEARVECPRRNTCLGCVKHVYNCVWCASSSECIVGERSALELCKDFLKEEMGCASSLSFVWLWIALGVVVLVFLFGFILVKTLPRSQAFRAVSLLIALGCGALLGMVLSYVIAACLVEISTSPFFSICFGLFFFYLAGLIAAETIFKKGNEHSPTATWERVAHFIAMGWIAISGVLCFILDKKLVMFMPEGLKVVLFGFLAAALNFCVVFSVVDLSNELYERLTRKKTSTMGLSEMLEGSSGQSSRGYFKIARNKARFGLLILASLLSGLYFGLVFGLMRIEEEDIYRASLMLRQESVYTFPAGATVGGICGLLLQLLSLPATHNEHEVDRIIAEARDDL